MTDHITIPRALLEQALDELLPISHNSTDDPRGQADKAIALIRAELAKPEQEESFIPDWANYRQGVADGKAGSPKWHDAPTEPGLWACVNSDGHRLFQEIASSGLKWVAQDGDRWYGPISQDPESKP